MNFQTKNKNLKFITYSIINNSTSAYFYQYFLMINENGHIVYIARNVMKMLT